MSVFGSADPGVRHNRTFWRRKARVLADVPIGKVIPLGGKFCLPGDIWHLNQQVFLRAQPMLAPVLTDINARVRAWFVPLRQLDDNTEQIITGSKNGKVLADTAVPHFKGFFDDATGEGSSKSVDKYSVMDYMISMPTGDYSSVYDIDGIPALYWLKAYEKIWFDWYRDENLSSFDDFDTFWDTLKIAPGKVMPFYANWRKDYYTSALTHQQKGVAPTLQFSLYTENAGTLVSEIPVVVPSSATPPARPYSDSKETVAGATANGYAPVGTVWSTDHIANPFVVSTSGLYSSIDTSDLRYLTQLQRILERLGRCGSRYTEYLVANFQTHPLDLSLQRVKYLGGYKQPVVISQVEQTAEDGATPVGTLRGKGVSFDNHSLPSFACQEFGVIIVTLEIMPKSLYTQGIPKEYTYKDRYDFYNPSFANLSEQEIRNSELYIDLASKSNCNGTFGFTEIYNELRSDRDRACGDMRDSMSYWLLPRTFSSTPVLSETFVQAQDDFTGPWAWDSSHAPQFICEMYHRDGVYRPMPRYGTPGLVDHG